MNTDNWSRYNYARVGKYINNFRFLLSDEGLTQNDLYALLYNYFKRLGWNWDNKNVDINGTRLFAKNDFDNIVENNFKNGNVAYNLEELIKTFEKRYSCDRNKAIYLLRRSRIFIDVYFKRKETLQQKEVTKKSQPQYIQGTLFEEIVKEVLENMKK